MARAARGKGEGSVYERGDGKWIAQVEAGRLPSGRRRYSRVTCRTKKEALAALRDLQRQADVGVRPDRTQTVGQYLDWWAANVLPGSVKESTVENYCTVIAAYIQPHVGAVRLAKLSPQDVATMLRELEQTGLSPRTRQYARAVLRRALRWAEQSGLVLRNAAALADGPKKSTTKLDDALTAPQAEAVIEAAAGHRLAALPLVALRLGLRKGELLALRWSDVDLDAGHLSVGGTLKRVGWRHGCDDPAVCAQPLHRKGCKAKCDKHRRCPRPCPPGCTRHADKCPQRQGGGLSLDTTKTDAGARTIPLVAGTMEALRDHRRRQAEERLAAPVWLESGHVFADALGGPLDGRNTLRVWHGWTEAAGVGRRRFHASRHTAATLLLDQGVPLEVVSAILGHAGLSITADTYAKVSQDSMRRALAKLDPTASTG
jgi:integrase